MLIDDLRQCFQQMVNAFIRNKSSGKQDDAPPVPSIMSKSGFPQCLGRRAEGRGKMLQTDSEMIDRNFIRQLRMPYRDIFQQKRLFTTMPSIHLAMFSNRRRSYTEAI